MKTAYILVGVPASGKTTWIENFAPNLTTTLIVSTDEFVEQYAKLEGKTYTEVFEEYMPEAVRKMTEAVIWARDRNKHIIWDQTSTTIASRAKKIRMLPGYRKVAVIIPTPTREELTRRLNSRPGKEIPIGVVDAMINNYQPPTMDEGFDEIWFVVQKQHL